jgi:hypothetical protein
VTQECFTWIAAIKTKVKSLTWLQKLFFKVEMVKKVNSDFLASDFDYKEVQLGHSHFVERRNPKNRAELEMLFEAASQS